MKIYNSLSKKTENFKPIEDNKVLMYVCGLTPYDSTHIGHARTYVAFDTVKRFLIHNGYSVYHIQNITDVEDKIIKRCLETGADPVKLTSEFHDKALELFDRLHILRADIYPKVTEHIPDIILMVQTLLKKGNAYESEDGVYLDVSTIKDYGILSSQDTDQMKTGVRKEAASGKRNPLDFALWKKSNGEIIEFDSPWGKGRPGWHIECSAMSYKYGKRTLDIHGGARDLIFPHHENEIAQSEAATGKPFCKYWMHTGFLTVEHEKMSKSLGNFITLERSLSKFSSNALRLFYLQAHYRSPLDYEEDVLEAAEESVQRIFNSIGLIKEAEKDKKSVKDQDFRIDSDRLVKEFHSCMEADFDTPRALAALFGLLRISNAHVAKDSIDRPQLKKVLKETERMLWILGLEEEKHSVEGNLQSILSILTDLGASAKPKNAEDALNLLISMRDDARKKKDYKRSDSIRNRLKDIGIVLEDKDGKTGWKQV